MTKLLSGGSQPPEEPERTLDEMLDPKVRDAIDLLEEVEEESRFLKFFKNFGEQLAIAMIVGAVFFGVGVWWNSETHAETPTEEAAPEVNIGVDPN